jgi:hypothetical protein
MAGALARSGITYKVTKADTETVKNMVMLGSREETIAKCLGDRGIAIDTMRKHYADILLTYREMTLAKVAHGTIVKSALPDDKGNPGNLTSAMFLLKCRAGWRDQDPAMNVAAQNIQIVKRVIGIADDDI